MPGRIRGYGIRVALEAIRAGEPQGVAQHMKYGVAVSWGKRMMTAVGLEANRVEMMF